MTLGQNQGTVGGLQGKIIKLQFDNLWKVNIIAFSRFYSNLTFITGQILKFLFFKVVHMATSNCTHIY